MFQAIGRGVKKNADNTFTAKVEFIDERTTKSIRLQPFTVTSIAELRQKVRAELQTLRDNEQDATLNAAIVGIILGEI